MLVHLERSDCVVSLGCSQDGFKQCDLFGVIIIAIATWLGGGSLRDMLLERGVYWIKDLMFFISSPPSAVIIFITARLKVIPPWFFLSSPTLAYYFGRLLALRFNISLSMFRFKTRGATL